MYKTASHLLFSERLHGGMDELGHGVLLGVQLLGPLPADVLARRQQVLRPQPDGSHPHDRHDPRRRGTVKTYQGYARL